MNAAFITGELGDFIDADSGFPYGCDISGILKSLKHSITKYACISIPNLYENSASIMQKSF
jgi:hypothetical protein